ncbi:hypothetical protein NLI96_g12731 [Meripilus lineatus]|uniref:DUF6532 domain-containing protein n=1 Tax=Meripilus lineatus TaxID=2056292 RepID=A0AAD5UU14_9APHY|nr:hypothetical protein NLI96_g12731 [Physisporinus lineatus]
MHSKRLITTSKGLLSTIENKDGVAQFAHETLNTTAAAWYKTPSADKKERHGTYLSKYVIETYTATYAKKIRHSFLGECYDFEASPFPAGTLRLAVYAVHLGFRQFQSGKYVRATFTSDTMPRLWEGHGQNIEQLKETHKTAFLNTVKTFNPKEAVNDASLSAFDMIEAICFTSDEDSDFESGPESGEESRFESE